MLSRARARSFFTSFMFEVSDTQSLYNNANLVAAAVDYMVGFVEDGGRFKN